MIIIFLDNDLHAQLPAGLVPLVGRGGAADRLAQEEQQLPGQHRPCCLVFFDFMNVVVVLDVVILLFVIACIKVIRIKGARAKSKHRAGRTSNRLHVANGVPQRCGK